MKDSEIITRDIPLDQIESDPHQPRKEFGVDENDKKNRLMLSMQDAGQLNTIAVRKIGKDQYRVIAGERRLIAAKLLKWPSLRCDIHPVTDEGDVKRMRFDLENNHRLWRAPERSREVKGIKTLKRFETAKEVGDFLHMSESSMTVSLELQKKYDKYQEVMDEYGLPESYREEFIRLEPRIRPIRDFTKDKIIKNLFTRVKHQVIHNAKDFNRLGIIFIRAHNNEKEIYAYLSDPDMKVGELADRIKRDSLIRDIESVMRQTSKRLSEGVAFPPEVRKAMIQFRALLNKSL
ncbi:MAG TPA: ParB N-terminal domain-containing protein [Candidatus Paceibacterota bacterium]